MTSPDDRTTPYVTGQPTPNVPSTPAYPIPAQPQSPAGYPVPYSPVPYPAYGPLVRPTSGMATASMIFGIAGLLLFCLVIPSLVAVICGHSALVETRQGHKAGHGQAVAGLILGYAVLIPVVIFGVVWLVGLITT